MSNSRINIIQGDITKIAVDTIVNADNTSSFVLLMKIIRSFPKVS
ncbi:O-acetyl-ADP-ribose deacetylase [Xenorhabdus kozodoii]|uniref:O-acetyl-ADP-ribose deacetylase n=1 Tax=Xenorhabdus kozodoii TaxID=351676 RepID=A0A2D0L685_9GAMM|nr:O-acetyl-ADP-ribose deacetylase [Xenorhabdus kozodoii]